MKLVRFADGKRSWKLKTSQQADWNDFSEFLLQSLAIDCLSWLVNDSPDDSPDESLGSKSDMTGSGMTNRWINSALAMLT